MKNLLKIAPNYIVLIGVLFLFSCGGDSCSDGIIDLRFTNTGDKSIDIDPTFAALPYASLFNSSALSNIAPGEVAQIGVDREQWKNLAAGATNADLTVIEHIVETPLTTLMVDICNNGSDLAEINIAY